MNGLRVRRDSTKEGKHDGGGPYMRCHAVSDVLFGIVVASAVQAQSNIGVPSQ